jgi:hypothetical protein
MSGAAAQSLAAILGSQLDAALAMLEACIRACPAERWGDAVGRWPFWEVAYHTLCFADLYLAPGEAAWSPGKFQPNGMAELRGEHPSRRFEQMELVGYVEFCRGRARGVFAGETAEALARPTGFSWLPFSRAEGHIYNLRHIQHHAGQLSAFLRRAGVETKWVRAGA